MTKNGITKISISVKDMKASLDYYVNYFGCDIVGEQEFTNEEMKSAWGVADGLTAKAVYIKLGDARPTIIELIEFSTVSDVFKRSPEMPNYSVGSFDIGMRVKDMGVQYDKGVALGYKYFSPPQAYKAPWTGNPVEELVMWSPDNVPHAFMMSGENVGSGFTAITTNAYMTKDIDTGNKFFNEVLEMKTVSDAVMTPGFVCTILDIPREDAPRITMYMNPGFNCPVPELIQCLHEDGKVINEMFKAEDIGLIGSAYEVESVEETVAKAKALGYETIAGVMEMGNGPFGKIKAATIVAFDKELFQVYEIIS